MTRVVDLFAGCGGFSVGARAAGCRVLSAYNHWKASVQVHAMNHPDTNHMCQDLQQANFHETPAHDLLLASPACQGHSRARGVDRAHHDTQRATAWAVVACLEAHRTPAFLVENVPEFVEWVLFPAWRAALEALGYALSIQVWDAADCGVPQNRLRVLVAGVRGKTALQLESPKLEHVPASSFIDFTAGNWARINRRGRAPATLERCRAGRATHGERFLVSYYGSTKGGRALSRPIGTITTRDRWAVVNGDHMRMASTAEARIAMGFQASYSLTGHHKTDMHLLGNAIPPPMAEAAIRQMIGAV